jgi:alkylation response protein AidB-like acyl-CoA dehydrogenase
MSDKVEVSEEEAREVAEDSRQKDWSGESFTKELFLGRFRPELLEGHPDADEESEEFLEYCRKLKHFMETEVDSAQIDEEGRYPEHVVEGLAEMGAFGMKISEKYGGLGFSQAEYSKVLELLGRYDGNIIALLSAHQSIGVPQPIKLFGTEEQKKEYLPRCAAGEISAFALTEPDVGSDPARLTTAYEDKGDHYVINGEKLWITNGTFADLMVVMARDPETKDISAFVVEADKDGITAPHRCRFMGLRAIENGVIRFDDVKIPKENLIGEEGAGLKIALVTLNNGRLSLPAGAVGSVKKSIEYAREFASARVQWGAPVGKHEAVAHKLSDIATKSFAMESVSEMASALAMREDYDIRLAAAVAKEFNSTRQWSIADETLQIRGGRGYETEQSLEERGEEPVPVERVMRDSRINMIFEGSSEIMHLFIAREAVDKHLDVSGVLIEKDSTFMDILKALPSIIFFYARWYTSQWIGWSYWPKYSEYGKLATHMRFIDRASRKLARNLFHGMALYQAKLEKKQAFLFRGVDIGNQLFAMAASLKRAKKMADEGAPHADRAARLADVFCRESRQEINKWFDRMWNNNDKAKYELAQELMDGDYKWLEDEIADTSGHENASLPDEAEEDASGSQDEPDQADEREAAPAE